MYTRFHRTQLCITNTFNYHNNNQSCQDCVIPRSPNIMQILDLSATAWNCLVKRGKIEETPTWQGIVKIFRSLSAQFPFIRAEFQFMSAEFAFSDFCRILGSLCRAPFAFLSADF